MVLEIYECFNIFAGPRFLFNEPLFLEGQLMISFSYFLYAFTRVLPADHCECRVILSSFLILIVVLCKLTTGTMFNYKRNKTF